MTRGSYCSVVATLMAAQAATAQIEYSVEILPDPPSEFRSFLIRGIDESGGLYGTLFLEDHPPDETDRRPYTWSQLNGFEPLPILPGFVGGDLNGMSKNGVGVGVLYDQMPGRGSARIVRWSGGEVFDWGPTNPNGPWQFEQGMNRSGQFTSHTDGDAGLFFDGLDNHLIEGIGRRIFPLGLNDAGVVVGSTDAGKRRAFRWTRDEGMRLLDDDSPIDWIFVATDINNSGMIIGRGYEDPDTGQFVDRAFVLTDTDGLVDIDPFDDSVRSFAIDVNDRGTVIGYLRPGAIRDPFIYDQTNGSRLLQDLIDPALEIELLSVSALNEAGQIVAVGRLADRSTAKLILSPVPAPASFVVLLLSTARIGRRRRA